MVFDLLIQFLFHATYMAKLIVFFSITATRFHQVTSTLAISSKQTKFYLTTENKKPQ